MSLGQSFGECFFDIAYLTTALTLGTIICVKSPSQYYTMFGTMGMLLTCGDAFYLIPRMIGLLTNNMQTLWLGLGELITSFTMIIFYVMLYFIVEMRIIYN